MMHGTTNIKNSLRGPRSLSRYSDWIRAGRSGYRIPVKARFSALVHTVPGAHPGFRTLETGSFPEAQSGRDVTLTPHPLLVPWSRKVRAIPLLPLWAVRPVQSLSACTRGALYLYLPYSLRGHFIGHGCVCKCCCLLKKAKLQIHSDFMRGC